MKTQKNAEKQTTVFVLGIDMATVINLFWQQTAVDNGSWRRTIADDDEKIIIF